MGFSHSRRRATYDVASRNLDRARRRWIWVLAKAKAVDRGPIGAESGGVMNEPSEDEFIPCARGSRRRPLVPPSFGPRLQ